MISTREELETAIIATALTYEGAAFEMYQQIKSEEMFELPYHKALAYGIRSLVAKGETPALYNVIHKADELGNFQPQELTIYAVGLADKAQPPSVIPDYCQLMLNHYVKAELPKIALDIKHLEDNRKEDYSSLLAKAHSYISKVEEQVRQVKAKSFKDHAGDFIEKIKENLSKGLNGLPFGLSELDRVTGGAQEGDLIIIAGRPGMGKTALALKMTLFNALRGTPVVFYTREMTPFQLLMRFVAMTSKYFNMGMLALGGVKEDKITLLQKDVKEIKDLPININDETYILDDIIFEVKKFAMQNPQGLIVIDYLQLLEGARGKRYKDDTAKITDITRNLKQVAKSTGIPIILLSQLSRSVESRADKEPVLSDLKLSGSIEEDANMVIFPFRAEYYSIDQFKNGKSSHGKAKLIVAKHRNSKTGAVYSDYVGNKVLFEDEQPEELNQVF